MKAQRPLEPHANHSPRPRVRLVPICSLFSAWWLSKAWASVLTAQNSTPCAHGPHGAQFKLGSATRGLWCRACTHRQAAADHAVHGVATTAAHAHHLHGGTTDP